MLLWGVPIALIGVWPNSAFALVLLLLVGIGNTIVDVAGLTLLQRAVPDEVLARVFGAVNSIAVGTLGIGALLAPLLIDGLGVRGALIVTGALLPVMTAVLFRRLSALDRGAVVAERARPVARESDLFVAAATDAGGLAGQLTPVRPPRATSSSARATMAIATT